MTTRTRHDESRGDPPLSHNIPIFRYSKKSPTKARFRRAESGFRPGIAAPKEHGQSAKAEAGGAGAAPTRGGSAITTPRGGVVKGQEAPAPPSKGGPKTRGGWYQAHIDNHTGYPVDCYINGKYVGTVSAYGDLYPSVTAGGYSYYCEVDFTDGSNLHWTSQRTSGNSYFSIGY